jgi:hypothetical protein
MAAKHDQKRRRGRPRRYAPGKRPTLTFRVQEDMHRDLAKTAKAKGYSISEEIEHRLTEWAQAGNIREQAEDMREEAKTALIAASTQLDVARIQAIRKAGCQILRDAGGNVTVNVSPELLLAEAEGVLRYQVDIQQETDPAIRAALQSAMGEENVDKSPQEIMIQRVVERAIENALTKAGLIGRKGVA